MATAMSTINRMKTIVTKVGSIRSLLPDWRINVVWLPREFYEDRHFPVIQVQLPDYGGEDPKARLHRP